ncbi:outer membrane lipoprotein carrier protein LolA [Methanoculleus sp.]|uniref:LolA family protein n=1 Tax=Methanoculleus sp. TaxID=90427 RepID=UPI001BD2087B|nr:outer membrane lipoprotein carrier protein LolA [Methanoculleus sp.]
MRLRRWISWFLVVAACVAAGCTVGPATTAPLPPNETLTPEEVPPPGPEVVARFIETYDSLQDFSATVTTVSERGTFREEVWFKKPDRFRVNYLDEHPTDPGHPAKTGDLVVFDGETQWHYVNTTGNVLYISARARNYTFGEEYAMGAFDALGLIRNLLASHECLLSEVRTEDGETIYTLEIANTTQIAETPDRRWYPVYAVHAGIEKDSWILRRADFFNAKGKALLTVEYRNVTWNTGIPDSMFQYSPPEGAAVKPMRTVAITPPYTGP